MPAKKSSSAVSSIAARILRMKLAADGPIAVEDYNNLLAVAKTLAGSVLSQDETKGQDS